MAVFCIAQSLRSVSFLLGQTSYLCSRQILSSSKTLRCIFAFSWSFFKKSLSSLYKVFLRPAPTYASPDRVLFFSQRYLGYYVGAISPSGQLRHHRLPLLQVTLIHPAQFSHKRALCLSTTFFYFRIGTTCSDPNALQVLPERICVHPPAHSVFILLQVGSFSLPSHPFLEPAFL